MTNKSIRESAEFNKEIKELGDLIAMRLSPNEAYSSDQMDNMIQQKVKSIIVRFQEEP